MLDVHNRAVGRVGFFLKAGREGSVFKRRTSLSRNIE